MDGLNVADLQDPDKLVGGVVRQCALHELVTVLVSVFLMSVGHVTNGCMGPPFCRAHVEKAF